MKTLVHRFQPDAEASAEPVTEGPASGEERVDAQGGPEPSELRTVAHGPHVLASTQFLSARAEHRGRHEHAEAKGATVVLQDFGIDARRGHVSSPSSSR